MKRLLLVAALLVASVAPARAQGDARKLAIFYTGGTNHNRTTGSLETTGNRVSQTNHMLLVALDRMGVPYTIFNIPDSTGGWKATMRATRPNAMADSTWFRQNGYFGCVAILSDVNSTVGTDIIRYFTDGNAAGTQAGSPLSGRWGIPVLVFNMYGSNEAGLSYYNGANGTDFTLRIGKSFFASSGTPDSLGLVTAQHQTYSVGEAADVTRLIMSGDSLNAGTMMSAWRYKTSTYFYDMPSYERPVMLLLGLAKLFSHAGYTPRRKLNLHMTFDHIYPETITSTASSESLYTYMNWLALRVQGATKAAETERAANSTEIVNYWRARQNVFATAPHSHNVLDLVVTPWNYTTWADTNIIRQRWNFLEAAITDTMKLNPARGFERTIGFPSDAVHFPHLYVMAQNGYTDIRAGASDSIGGGRSQNLSSYRRVWAARPLTSTTNIHRWSLPYRYTEPVSGRGIWVHDLDSHPGGAATTWAAVTYDQTDGIDGKAAANMNRLAFAILWDADYYWHPNQNLEGADLFMATFMRRLVYLYGRVSNIVTISPSYRPKFPRRSSVSG